ncbi:MAG: hypothetical protein ABFS30_03135 [Pseudomonadota bacterium]
MNCGTYPAISPGKLGVFSAGETLGAMYEWELAEAVRKLCCGFVPNAVSARAAVAEQAGPDTPPGYKLASTARMRKMSVMFKAMMQDNAERRFHIAGINRSMGPCQASRREPVHRRPRRIEI